MPKGSSVEDQSMRAGSNVAVAAKGKSLPSICVMRSLRHDENVLPATSHSKATGMEAGKPKQRGGVSASRKEGVLVVDRPFSEEPSTTAVQKIAPLKKNKPADSSFRSPTLRTLEILPLQDVVKDAIDTPPDYLQRGRQRKRKTSESPWNCEVRSSCLP